VPRRAPAPPLREARSAFRSIAGQLEDVGVERVDPERHADVIEICGAARPDHVEAEAAVALPRVQLDSLFSLRDEYEVVKGRRREIALLFVTSIVCFGAPGQDLDDDRGIRRHVGCPRSQNEGPAHDDGVGIDEIVSQADLLIRRERGARIFETAFELPDDSGAESVVSRGPARHREDLTSHVKVLLRLLALPSEELVGAQPRDWLRHILQSSRPLRCYWP
jgi:hypothetical protein